MTVNPIHFGTSGWRGIIADDFTFSNVRLAAAGIAHHLLSRKGRPRILVGYDTRFLSEKFADTAVETLASHGIECYVATRPDRTDGLKLLREDGSWLLMRMSATEPLVRVYCEAASRAELDHLAEAAKSFVKKP